MYTQKDIKRLKAAERELRLANGYRSLETQTIPSRREKLADPRRQRKSRAWIKEFVHAYN